ncbi:ABC transporter ATP-binding protein [Dysgonomonas sp. Marseille-P4677]|uniref:ABC transporter ATP-binding protein n=1 Tax=Dysgonomonas sp. Marseille-P4677 TaxID=2364790 RepID=UPI00191454AD|nr:ABC transporter ATP-binding protein [Dysgonomonas sp. Marseille-P4677]MBK5719307.1 ABC transporter ATP-binding protein [Dysgonomonas sp. Marseille-P4677]
MKKYWHILKNYSSSLIICPFLVLITVMSETLQPLYMADIIDNGVLPKDLSVITHVGIKMIIVSLIGLVFSIINVFVSSRTSIGFGTDLRSSLFKKIQQLSFSEIDRFNSASLITRLTNDISRIQLVILMGMRLMLRSPLMLIMAIVFVIKINMDLAIILIGAIPILGISVFLILRKGFPLFMKVQQKVDKLNGVVRENLINIRVVKSFVREDFEARKFSKSSEDLRDMVIRASNIVVAIFPVMQLIMNLSVIVILWVGGGKVISGELKVGELISFVNYLVQILMALMLLSMVIMNIARASASSERILEVLNTEPSLANTPESLKKSLKINKGAVTFHNVYFRYSGGENDVLKDINFHIHQGETIAVVGATGAAKSSMLQLIPRLYDTTKGEVLIDGVNVKDYNLDELHSEIGMVLQKNELFTGTIIDNLRWGKSDATIEEIEEAAKAAQAHEFIMSFSDGYNTLLGRGGVNLSGGQKQRICIARALLRKPKILILDDSTSAVDSDTEQKIRQNLNKLLHDTTVFIITQRINTMQSADRVIVLEDGEIDAIGRPLELIEQSKVYQEIYNSQQIAF